MAASLNVGVGGAWKAVQGLSVGVGAAWKSVEVAYVGVSGSWVPFFTALSVAISAGSSSSGASGGNAFGTNTAVVTGGVGPFTYQWHESDDGLGTWTAPGTSAAQTITVSGVILTESSTANYYCVVTDTGTSLTATSNTASYTWNHT